MWGNSLIKSRTLRIFGVTSFKMIRNIAQATQAKIEDPPNPRCPEKTKLVDKETRNKLRAILDIKEFEALRLVLSHKKLCSTPVSLMIKNYCICGNVGISKEMILEYPFLLYETKLTEKIAKLAPLPLQLSESIPLAQLGMRRLSTTVLNVGECLEKIYDLSRVFSVTPVKACDILAKRPFMLSLSLTELEELLNIFHEYDFTNEDVLNDLWIFKYSKDLIKDRLDLVKDRNINSLKTWMIRCPEDTLQKHIKKKSDNRDILGENSLAEYFSKKLNCSEAVTKSIIRKLPQLQSKNLFKMNAMIDLLYKAGFTSVQICKVPKILLHSIETTEQKLKQLKSLGKKPDNIYILIKSQRQYKKHVESLVKAKEEEED